MAHEVTIETVNAVAQDAVRRALANEAEGIASELELLVEDVADAKLASLQSSIEKRFRSVGEVVDQAIKDLTRKAQEDAAEQYDPDQNYAYGDSVAYLGGTWRCAARKGAKPGQAPGPNSPQWILTSDGIADVIVDQKSHNELSIKIERASGESFKTSVGLPGISPQGTWDETRTYQIGDAVSRNGGLFIARRTTSGPCPGPDWQLAAQRGRTGSASKEALKRALDEMTRTGDVTSAETRLQREFYSLVTTLSAKMPDRANSAERYEAFAITFARFAIAIFRSEALNETRAFTDMDDNSDCKDAALAPALKSLIDVVAMAAELGHAPISTDEVEQARRFGRKGALVPSQGAKRTVEQAVKRTLAAEATILPSVLDELVRIGGRADTRKAAEDTIQKAIIESAAGGSVEDVRSIVEEAPAFLTTPNPFAGEREKEFHKAMSLMVASAIGQIADRRLAA